MKKSVQQTYMDLKQEEEAIKDKVNAKNAAIAAQMAAMYPQGVPGQ